MREKGESVKEFREIQGFRKWGRGALDAGRLIPARDAGMDTQERGDRHPCRSFAPGTRTIRMYSFDGRSQT